MDKENPSLPTNKNHDSSPRKPPATTTTTTTTGGGGGGDRLKRDEWSEGAVSTLLEAYEAKWVLRNRAKLKGHDWEDVARYVSSRANSSKSPKTQTQCKNKIESMKKRYRSESATSDVSSWPLFPRLDLLLRGTGAPPPPAVDPPSSAPSAANNRPLTAFELTPPLQPPPAPPQLHSSTTPAIVTVPEPDPAPLQLGVAPNSIDSVGVDRENKEHATGTKEPEPNHQPSDKMEVETDCSTPALYSNDKPNFRSKNHKARTTDAKKRRRKEEEWDIAESIRWLAKVVVRSEQAKIETMRELEKMRTDAEIKRGEIDLRRTEIIANTQLEIARLFAASFGKGVDPSLRIGRS